MPEPSSRNDSLNAFKRSLDERFRQFLTDLQAVAEAIATKGHGEHVFGPLMKMTEAARDLHDYLAEIDRPKWLRQIYANAQSYAAHRTPTKAHEFLQTLLKHWTSVREIEFPDDGEPPFLDFDHVFEKYRDENRLPDLFDELVAQLNKIIDSNAVDSIAALEALRTMINLLKTNREGSYNSIKNTIVSVDFLWNLAREALIDLPVAKQLVGAFERTKEEAKAKFNDADADTHRQIIEELAKRAPRLERLPNYQESSLQFVSPLHLPAPDKTDGTPIN